ncbi:MAG: SPOR domain-containing protein [Burkholderiaceae bacterium]|nr:SPOR domain-containing protein [Burkholderiaceae bacterium]
MARRSPADGAALDPALTQKKRARRRLVGAVVLGIVAAIVLPLVLDSEPRQTITDVEIEIPPREAALPALDSPAQPEVAAAGVAEDAVALPPAPAEPIAVPKPDPKAEAQLPPRREAKPSTEQAPARIEPKPGPAAPPRSSAKSEAPKVAGAKPHSEASVPARSESGAAKSSTTRSESRPEPASAGASRFALQLGAFANAGSARAQLDKARRTGLRAYTETVNTAQGERTRVRVGPFASREEAEKARATLKLSGIDSSVVDAR